MTWLTTMTDLLAGCAQAEAEAEAQLSPEMRAEHTLLCTHTSHTEGAWKILADRYTYNPELEALAAITDFRRKVRGLEKERSSSVPTNLHTEESAPKLMVVVTPG